MTETFLDINYRDFAADLLDMFTEEERNRAVLGLFPAEKMLKLKSALKRRISGLAGELEGDSMLAVARGEVIEFSLSKAVSEVMHKLTVEMIRQAGDA